MKTSLTDRPIMCTALCALLALASCSNDNGQSSASVSAVQISGTVLYVNDYGQPVPSFTPEEMKEAGFDYADLINVQIGDTLKLTNIPYITSFNEAGILSPTYVDYNARGDTYGFGMLNGDFHYYIGGEEGDTLIMTLSEKGGYKKTYELMKSVYPVERRAGETAEEYANFRPVTTTGMAQGVLYRSSNPLNIKDNAGRYVVADSLAQTVGIKTEIDLADTSEKIAAYRTYTGYGATYCLQLFDEGNTIACGMMANSFNDDFKTKMGKAVKFMIEKEPPYLIHCNEGKDRCGFVSMLFEALAGASIDELRRDYMVTLLNFYKVEDGGESYCLRQRLSIDRLMWLLCHEEMLKNFNSINWDKMVFSDTDIEESDMYHISRKTLQQAARKYLVECGLTEEECDTFRKILTTGKK